MILFFDRPMVLLNNVVQVFHPSKLCIYKDSLLLHCCKSRWISLILIDIDYSWISDRRKLLKEGKWRYNRMLCLGINERILGKLKTFSINKEIRSWKSMMNYQDFSKV